MPTSYKILHERLHCNTSMVPSLFVSYDKAYQDALKVAESYLGVLDHNCVSFKRIGDRIVDVAFQWSPDFVPGQDFFDMVYGTFTLTKIVTVKDGLVTVHHASEKIDLHEILKNL